MRAEGAKDGKPTQYLWKYLVEDVLADAPYADFPMADGVVTKQYNTSTGAIVSSGGATGYYTEDNLPEDVVDPAVDPYALATQQSVAGTTDTTTPAA